MTATREINSSFLEDIKTLEAAGLDAANTSIRVAVFPGEDIYGKDIYHNFPDRCAALKSATNYFLRSDRGLDELPALAASGSFCPECLEDGKFALVADEGNPLQVQSRTAGLLPRKVSAGLAQFLRLDNDPTNLEDLISWTAAYTEGSMALRQKRDRELARMPELLESLQAKEVNLNIQRVKLRTGSLAWQLKYALALQVTSKRMTLATSGAVPSAIKTLHSLEAEMDRKLVEEIASSEVFVLGMYANLYGEANLQRTTAHIWTAERIWFDGFEIEQVPLALHLALTEGRPSFNGHHAVLERPLTEKQLETLRVLVRDDRSNPAGASGLSIQEMAETALNL